MKTRYKNKRDFYKAEAERHAKNAEFWKKEFEEINTRNKILPQSEGVREIKVVWFCKQCRVVAKGTVNYGVNIERCACLNCGARELLAVSRLPEWYNL